ncbi:hypothetical protein N7G274_000837 [Stereocaulon virgatum]|uniref:F-box domain-containing protein n=1 Tax=Stereocaulon virgatum TaxID=373712 RepID=A0ABR4AQ98_9LECA
MNVLSIILELQSEVSRLDSRVKHLELELLRDKPTFPFLQLPREIRDRIYLYALKCPAFAKIHPQVMEWFKPSTPAICLVNRQLSAEANEILYSKNMMHFDEPEEIHNCLEAIGTINKAYIRSISLWFDYRTIEQCRRDGTSGLANSSDWAKALLGSGLTKLNKIKIQTECVGAESYSCYHPSMDPVLVRAIKYLFRQEQEGPTRHLMLTGFNYDNRRRFPGSWRVTMTQFAPDWIDEAEYAGLMPTPPPEYLDDNET